MEIPKNGWLMSWKIPSFEMDDDWGYPYDETETSTCKHGDFPLLVGFTEGCLGDDRKKMPHLKPALKKYERIIYNVGEVSGPTKIWRVVLNGHSILLELMNCGR